MVYVPRSVQKEVSRKSIFRYRLKRLYRSAFFEQCNAANQTDVRLLTERRGIPRTAALGVGEAEALVQAREKGATFFIVDEKRAREVGERMGLKPIGTLRILARLHREGHVEDPQALLSNLRKEVGYRITDEIIHEAMAKADEPI